MKRVWEIINPHDKITFVANEAEAALMAERLLPGLYFVQSVETRKPPVCEDLCGWYTQLFFSAEKIASLAEAYCSALIGNRKEFDLLATGMSPEQKAAFAAKWHDEKRTSMVDLCAKLWEVGEKIKAVRATDR